MLAPRTQPTGLFGRWPRYLAIGLGRALSSAGYLAKRTRRSFKSIATYDVIYGGEPPGCNPGNDFKRPQAFYIKASNLLKPIRYQHNRHRTLPTEQMAAIMLSDINGE